MQESMYKNSQWPEYERHKHFIHNECNALFRLTQYQQTHTFNIQGSKYSILDVHSPISKHNVGYSNGSEIPALTEVVTLEIDVCTTNV